MAPERTPQIHVNLTNRILSINGVRRFRLDDSLFNAGISRVLNNEKGSVLTIGYEPKIQDLCDEGKRISKFLQKYFKTNIQVSSELMPLDEIPKVYLVGEMMAKVCS